MSRRLRAMVPNTTTGINLVAEGWPWNPGDNVVLPEGEDEPYDHRSSKASDFYKNIRFSDLLLQQGVLKAAEKFFISAVHSDDDIERTVQAFHVALGQLAKEIA